MQTIMRSSILFLLAVGATSFAAPPLAKPPRFQQRRAPVAAAGPAARAPVAYTHLRAHQTYLRMGYAVFCL